MDVIIYATHARIAINIFLVNETPGNQSNKL